MQKNILLSATQLTKRVLTKDFTNYIKHPYCTALSTKLNENYFLTCERNEITFKLFLLKINTE